MKIERVDHIGVAVNSIDAALKFFRDTLGLKLEGSETVA
ncbi:MAG: methylmalonyl-CoA epimerase, partial [Deltaproteobacteria bacterium]|nr:methylmalonyl-CoA epimerase [Deltaproteobacteria bacterium]MBM4272634.1 methylmalonyl-CoA epimerase [Deltaproteobacteria bacterium]